MGSGALSCMDNLGAHDASTDDALSVEVAA